MKEDLVNTQFEQLLKEHMDIINFLPISAKRKAIACYFKNRLSNEQIARKIGTSRQAVHSTCETC